MKTSNTHQTIEMINLTSVSPYQKQTLAQRAKDLLQNLNPKQRLGLKGLMILGLCASFLYVTYFSNHILALPALLVLMATVEGTSQLLGASKHKMSLERVIFMITGLLQASQISFWGWQSEWGWAQLLSLHLSFLFYLTARTNQFSQGRIGLMVASDVLYSSCLLPLKYFFLSFFSLFFPSKEKVALTPTEKQQKQVQRGMIFISILVALGLVAFAASQLSQVLPAFGNLFKQFFITLGQALMLDIDLAAFATNILRLLISIPLALGLLAQLMASYLTKDKALSQDQMENHLLKTRLFPKTAAYIVVGSLCLLYSLFIVTALGQVGNLLSLNQTSIPAHQASTIAVDGFWQLVRVSCLNFGVLASLYVFSKDSIFDHKGLRFILTLLFSFATLFALIAGWKLFGVYIAFYGLTPRRLLSGWFITVLLTWCILTLIRFHKPIQAIRWGIFYASISFTLVSLLASFIL